MSDLYRTIGCLAVTGAWLRVPAIGLNGQRSADSLFTRKGAETVAVLLGKLEYGVKS